MIIKPASQILSPTNKDCKKVKNSISSISQSNIKPHKIIRLAPNLIRKDSFILYLDPIKIITFII